MSLQAALEFFDDIAATKGTTAKLDKLQLATDLQKLVLLYALDPYRMYGVKKRPTARVLSDPSQRGFFETLDSLAAREITGMRAINACNQLVAEGVVPDELLTRILNKDLRCGLAATSVNKVFPKLIPEFKVALAEEYEDDGVWPKFESEKYDGLRGLAFVTQDGVVFKTRNGLEITSVEHLHAPLKNLSWETGLVFDGEIKLPKGHFQDSSGSARKKSQGDESLEFFIFDWLTIEEFLERTSVLTQVDRLEALGEWARFGTLSEDGGHWALGNGLNVVRHTLVGNDTEAQRRYEEVLSRKGEGLILKNPHAPYQFKRSTAWVKMKDVQSADCRVTGVIPGKGKYAGMVGALEVEFEGLVDKVGTGISDFQRSEWIENPDLIVGKVIEVNYHEKTKDGHMRHSRLNKIRWDKE